MIRFVFIDTHFSKEDSDLSEMPQAVQWEIKEDEWQMHIPPHCQLSQPIHCLYLTREKTVSHMRRRLVFSENTSVTWIEEYCGEMPEYRTEWHTIVIAEKNAKLYFLSLQNEAHLAEHISKTELTQYQNSEVTWHTLSCGAMNAKQSSFIKLNESGARCTAKGIYWLNEDKQDYEQDYYVDHVASSSHSDLLFKGVLQKKSKSTWKSKVYVNPEAKHIQSHQANHHLLLSKEAEASAKPELEIYADDVKCSHGATVGQIDDDAIFYLRSRGIAESEAKNILTQAFLSDIANELTDTTAIHAWKKVLMQRGESICL